MRAITNASHFRDDGYRSIVKLVSSSHTITEANIVQGGFIYDSRVVEGSAFQVGTAIADEIHVTLDNSTGVYNRSYLGEEFTVSISNVNISTGTQDSWTQYGIFIVTEVDESDSFTTTMVLQDRMILLDQVIPSFTVDTLLANLSAFCTALGFSLNSQSAQVTNPLTKFTVTGTTNENGITYRDFVRGCGLLLGRNARFTRDGNLQFTQTIGSSTYAATLTPSDRFSSRLGELQHLGGVEVYDEDGTLLYSRNLHNDDTYRVVIDPSSSVIIDLIGGIDAVVTGFQACVTAGTQYMPMSFFFDHDYYPVEISAMNWWEIQTWDRIGYTDKNNNTYPVIVTSVASVLNGRTSISSTADEKEEDRYVPTQTDYTRTTNKQIKTSVSDAHHAALVAMPKYGTNSQSSSTVAKTVAVDNFVLTSGAKVTVLFSNKNTAASPTLNVAGTGAYAIKTSDGQPLPKTNVADDTEVGWGANSLVSFVFYENGANSSWRVDDASALTKIDNLLTDNIVGDNGWINLKGGEFVFTDADTGDSIGFNDGIVTVTGLIDSSKIQGEQLDIEGEGNVTYTPGQGQLSMTPKYLYRVRTAPGAYIDEDDSSWGYTYVQLKSWVNHGSLAETLCSSMVEIDPVTGVKIESFPLEDGTAFEVSNEQTSLQFGTWADEGVGGTTYTPFFLVGDVDMMISSTEYTSLASKLGIA